MDVHGYTDGRLGEDYVNFFRAFGFLIFRSFLEAGEFEALKKEFAEEISRHHLGRKFNPAAESEADRRYWSIMMTSRTPTHVALLEDQRLITLARQLYASDVIGIKVQSNRFGGSTPWHRDTYTADRGGVKFIAYHEPVTRETGALRLIPGSHLLGNNYLFAEKMSRLSADTVPGHALETRPGDVIAFDMRAWHGTVGGHERHATDFSYYNDPRTQDEEEALRLRAATNVKILMQRFDAGKAYFYPREWVENRGGSAPRARWISRLREIGYFDSPGVLEPEETQSHGSVVTTVATNGGEA